MAAQKSDSKIFGLSTGEAAVVGVGIVAGVLVVKNIIDKTGNFFGVNDNTNTSAGVTINAWDPKFYKTAPNGTMLLSAADALRLAKKIYSYSGWFFDSPGVVIDALKEVRSKAEVSQISAAFSQEYSYDMYQYLLDGNGWINPANGLSNTNLTKINDYVKNLPNY